MPLPDRHFTTNDPREDVPHFTMAGLTKLKYYIQLAFKNLEETQMDSNLAESNINPSDLRAKFDAKMAEIREKQNRTQADRTEEEQEAIRFDKTP